MGKTPAECQSMDDVRVEIDRLDQEIVERLADRWSYVERAWQVKSNAADSRVRWRNEEVIERVRQTAEARQLPPELAETVWRLIIGWGIQYQQERLRRLEEAQGTSSGADDD